TVEPGSHPPKFSILLPPRQLMALNPAMSPGATLTLCFLSPRPSPRRGLAPRALTFDYCRPGESAQAACLVLMALVALQAAVGAVVVALAPGRHPAGLFALRMMRHHE